MNRIVWILRWSQPYTNWQPVELPITDFSQAREVLARIMSK